MFDMSEVRYSIPMLMERILPGDGQKVRYDRKFDIQCIRIRYITRVYCTLVYEGLQKAMARQDGPALGIEPMTSRGVSECEAGSPTHQGH